MEDTIAAISTSIGQSAINIVRISGDKSKKIANLIFSPANGKILNSTHKIQYGHIIDPKDKKTIDEVLFLFMKSPKTYTREDVVEFFCHGGIIPTYKILELTLKYGARLAQEGEFTKRAFINGRIDLAQAESVIDIIYAKTECSLHIAQKHLQGGLSNKINYLREILIKNLVDIEASIDFSEENLPFRKEKIMSDVLELKDEIKKLITAYDNYGYFLKEGLNVAIIGKPNVGKSSLLNALLQKQRAIVTSISGTTRDTIEETISIEGIPVNIIDTAGIKSKTKNLIEQEGIKRSLLSIDKANLILLVLDLSREFSKEDRKIIDKLNGKRTIIVLNKKDKKQKLKFDEELKKYTIIKISAIYNDGIDELKKSIVKPLLNENFSSDIPIIINLRHKQALLKTLNYLKCATEILQTEFSPAILAIDLKEALNSLEEIIGKTTTEDLLNKIFSKFCIGK